MNEIKIAKFELMIEKIDDKLSDDVWYRADEETKNGLSWIFDYDKLNDYGKIIMKKARVQMPNNRGTTIKLKKNFFNGITGIGMPLMTKEEKTDDVKEKIKAIKEFISQYKNAEEAVDTEEMYKFIFWALMIIVVDKTNTETHLERICDFATMMHIEDYEMEELANMVKAVFGITEWIYPRSININFIYQRLSHWDF